MKTGRRGFNLLITLLLVATWMGCSSDKQLIGPVGSAQVRLNIQFAQSVAKQNFGRKINNATQIIQEVTVSVLEAGSNAVVIKEQQLKINSTPQGRFAEGELSIPVREESQLFTIVVLAGDDDLSFFAGTANVTLEPGATSEEPVTIFLQPATSIASAGTVNVSSTFPLQGFGAANAIDLQFNTSWFSGGASADGNTSTFTWTSPQNVFLVTVVIFNNMLHNNPIYQSGFGFQTVTFQVYDGPDASGMMIYEETVDYPKTFPVVRVSPFGLGRSIRLLLNDHEDPSCGGFSELLVVAIDLSAGEPVRALQSIDVSPPNPTIDVGQTVQFQATGRYSDASTSDITNDVTWGINDQNVASITSAGLATGAGLGNATISATQGGINGQTRLTVSSVQLSAPTISNMQTTLLGLNDSTACSNGGSLLEISFGYTDPDGDVTDNAGGTAIDNSAVFEPGGSITGGTITSFTHSGNGFSGSISFLRCIVFGSTSTSIRRTISLIDAGGQMSNELTSTFDKPEGANSPPGGNITKRRAFEGLALPDKKF